jgi:CRP/FNR family cyclic AMP-dependent transcriptional regulator
MSRGLSAANSGSVLLFEAPPALSGQPDILARLTPGELARVLAAGDPVHFARGEFLFRQGAPHRGIFVLRAGVVRSFYVSPAGREITLAKWKPGNFVGGPDIFGDGVHVWSGIGVEGGEAIRLPGVIVRRLMTAIPNFAVGLVEGLAFKGKSYSALLQLLGTRSVLERLANLLFNLAQETGVPTADGVEIPTPPSHEELAAMAGATRQWVSVAVERFRTLGLVSVRERRLVVLRMSALRALADGEKAT